MARGDFLMTQISAGQRKRETSLGFLIQVLARRMDGDMKQRLAEIDVDIKIFANLMLLNEKDGITQRELGRGMLEFPEYFTSRTVDALVDRGFAVRKPDPKSRRSILVCLTPKGRKKAGELPAIIAAVNQKYMTPLETKERETLIKLLHKVAGINHD